MDPVSRNNAVVKDYTGLSLVGLASSNPNSGEASVQTNLTVDRQGELRVRPGLKTVEFDEE